MKRYSTYKPSPLPWNKDIPAHWISRRGKFIFKVINQRSKAGAEELLSVTENWGVIPRKNANVTMFQAESYEGYKLCEKGDLVINSLWAWGKGLGFSEYAGIVSTAYSVYRLKKHSEHNYKYYNYLLRTPGYVGEYLVRSKGVWISRLQLSDMAFLDIQIVIPPLEEQNAIVNYLDFQNEKINLFISKKQKLIELLKEQKQAIVNKHLDKNFPKIKLKFLINGKLKYGANESGEEYNEAYPRYIRITDFGANGNLSDDEKLSLKPEIAANYLLKDGDVLFARSGGTVGKTFQFKYADNSFVACYAGYLIKAEPNTKKILSDFLFYFTQSGIYERWKDAIFNKATIENIGADKYSQLLVPVPPVDEQENILAAIKEETGDIDEVIIRTEKEIELIKEYRQSLIAETVTGKIKVA